ncbi:right-handed parallel beta-helix repeat-containing protein [Acinetobacter variabilis]|uniref:right-handed parallel beta-helix repeat-containing protein n=1 Tax=Acinetobacter variabilis TaxID=70346 RepID=UPI0021CE71ED|nr:right-handed parallel beta-helix repeat-containing protein [Acinetobacter variabilis]MCU4373719.1 right-handed parallel beta-helix repeat-containing protein [Acinetobacter variabilis]
MAVPEQTPYSEHTGNGVTKSFALNFDCESKDHLIVLVNEIEPPIATWSLSGGNVVFTTAPISGSKVTIQRNTPFSRTVDYQSYNNSFRPQTVNGDFDRLWLKLQELGVADWLMKLYVDRLHQQQEEKIDDLKGYVDDRDDELRSYLLEEIRKQGVALDQLENYYNYLMQRLAQIAIDKGWDSSFVVYGNITQKEFNDNVSFFNAVSVLSAAEKVDIMLENPVLDLTAKAQLAIDIATSQGKICVFPYGTWNVDCADEAALSSQHIAGLIIPSNAKIGIMPKCTLKMMSTWAWAGQIFWISEVENVHIFGGGTILGDRKTHDFTNPLVPAERSTHEWVWGIHVASGVNVIIDNLRMLEWTGDCIHVWSKTKNVPSESKNVIIKDCVLDGARRNNISITDCDGFFILNNKIINAGITDANSAGVNPKAGIDLEPFRSGTWAGNERVMNGVVSGNYFKNNRLGGVLTFNCFNVSVTGNTSHGDGFNYCYGNNIVISNNVFHYYNKGSNSQSTTAIAGNGVPTLDWYPDFNNVSVIGNTILNFPTGIDARGTGINITGNTIKGSTTNGVSAYNLKNAKISENLIYDSLNGINISQLCGNIDIIGNKFSNISNRSISTGAFTGVLSIKGNTFKQCFYELHGSGRNNKFVFSENTIDRSATIYGSSPAVQVLDSGAELIASNNTMIAINGNPIQTVLGASLKAKNNTIDVLSGAILHNSTGKCVIDGNTISVNNLAASNPTQAIALGGTIGVIVSNNTVLGSPDGTKQFDTTITSSSATSSLLVGNMLTKAPVKALSDTERETIIIGKLYSASATYDPPSLATATQQSTTVTLTGAAIGDNIAVSFDKDLQGTRMWGEVTSTNTVTVYHRNDTGVTVDVGSGTLTVRLI